LTGESSTNEVWTLDCFSGDFSDIGDAPIGLGPVFCQDAPGERVLLYLPDRSGTRYGSFQTQLKAADSGEEAAYEHDAPSCLAESACF
tara:strand:- start:1210 stop:1473 length:264 start_codon:yes stop_codon:yes gene_type:complete